MKENNGNSSLLELENDARVVVLIGLLCKSNEPAQLLQDM